MPTATKTPARKPAAPKAPAKKTTKVSKYEPHPMRLRFFGPNVQRENAGVYTPTHAVLPTNENPANLVSSLCIDGKHRLVIDLDVPAHLEPSTTPGNSHLYIDVPMDWTVYQELLRALQRARIIEGGYAEASRAQGQTFVRLPGVTKPASQVKKPRPAPVFF